MSTEVTPEKDANAEFERRREIFRAYINSDEFQDKLKQRLQINDACQKKAKARQLTWSLCARPNNRAEGVIFFIENFGYTLDPRPQAVLTHIPFILFDYQKDAIRRMVDHIDNGRDWLVEKSRDMGMSWVLFAYVPLWYWLFDDGSNFLLGSYKEALVDDRTIDSLFGKIDYAVDSLPNWLLPNGFKKSKHRNHMKLTNPVTQNTITGDTMNPDFGRGSRKTCILFDELAFWDYGKDGWESSGDSTACRIANSTPNGYNFFAMLRETEIDISTYHWKEHPLKDEMWYEFEKARKTEEAVARELDISYSNSLEGRVYSEWNDAFVERGLFEYNPEIPLYVGWDFGKTDDTAIIWVQKVNGKLRIVDTYRNSGKNIDFYIPFITGMIPSDRYNYNPEEIQLIEKHKDWKTGTHFGDPAGRFRNQVSDETVIDILRNHGIHVNFRDQWKEFQKRKSAAKNRIRDGIEMNETPRTEYFHICMLNAAYPQVKSGGVKQTRSEKPKHDYTSHYRSAFEYLCLGLQEHVDNRYKSVDKFDKSKMKRRHSNRAVGY